MTDMAPKTAAELDQATLDQLQAATAAGAEALAQALPIMKALMLVTTAMSTLVFEKLGVDRDGFVEMLTEGVDEPTAAVIRQIVPRIEPVH